MEPAASDGISVPKQPLLPASPDVRMCPYCADDMVVHMCAVRTRVSVALGACVFAAAAFPDTHMLALCTCRVSVYPLCDALALCCSAEIAAGSTATASEPAHGRRQEVQGSAAQKYASGFFTHHSRFSVLMPVRAYVCCACACRRIRAGRERAVQRCTQGARGHRLPVERLRRLRGRVQARRGVRAYTHTNIHPRAHIPGSTLNNEIHNPTLALFAHSSVAAARTEWCTRGSRRRPTQCLPSRR